MYMIIHKIFKVEIDKVMSMTYALNFNAWIFPMEIPRSWTEFFNF